jgi:histidyl-tRNA synthetase
MAKINTQVMSGFMELLPQDQLVFNNMLDIITTTYEQFGFIPLDTPVIERSEVLFAKAGVEIEKQIYRIEKSDTEQALRFDLTVPLARYVSEHLNDLTFPFRRYHIGKVYRGERAQKGRYREFYQCDIDIIGNGALSLINDAEILSVINTTFTKLNLGNFIIKINNRKILNGFFSEHNLASKNTDILRIVDKLDKIGQAAVIQELYTLGITQNIASKISTFLEIQGTPAEIIDRLKKLLITDQQFLTGIAELETVVTQLQALDVPQNRYIIDLTIARGLDYYTGTVYETILTQLPTAGSVCGGGRYENLAESYCNQKLPGVGVSIGLTRLFSQLKTAGLIKYSGATPSKVMVIPMVTDLTQPLQVATKLRAAGTNTEVYFEDAKLKKKLDYANKLGINYVILLGEDEISSNQVTLKNMHTGQQSTTSFENILKIIQS